MINRFLIAISILLISDSIFGQAEFYLDLSGTYPFIPKMEKVDESIFTDIFGNPSTIKVTEDYKVKPGFSAEVGFNKKIIHRISINSGIGLSFYQYSINRQ